MASGQAQLVLRHVRRVLAAHEADQLSDRELLRRFHLQRDESAFTALVRRHGPMVLGVCRRVLANPHDADDVFQAAFFILARKAGSRTWQPSVGPWLHVVAHRLALRIRSAAERRTRYETQLPNRPPDDPLATITGRELCAVIDGELNALPERLRAPLVLCCLEGHTRDEAARHLGWSLATLKRRLDEGRRRLRLRLERRGFQLPAALAGVLVADGVSRGQVPPTLIQSLTRAAQAGAVPSPRVLALMDAFLRGTLFCRLRTVTVVFLMAGFLSASAGGLGLLLNRPQPADAPQAKAESDKPKAKSDGVRVDAYGDPLPEGAVARLGTIRFRTQTYGRLAAFSLDGKSLISVAGEMKVFAAGEDRSVTFCSWDIQSGKLLRQFGGKQWNRDCAGLSVDQKRLATADLEGWITVWDVAAGKEERRMRAGTHSPYALAFAPDGRKLASVSPFEPSRIWDVDNGQELLQLEGNADKATCVAFAPDGKTLVTGNATGGVCLVDVTTGKAIREWHKDHTRRIQALCFGPDGKTLASTANGEKTIRLRDVAGDEGGRALSVDADIHCLTFSPNGLMLAGGGWHGTRCPIHLWDLKSGKILPPLNGHFFGVESVAFSGDGKRLVSIGVDNAVRLWDLATGKELSPNAEHFSWVTSIVFLHGGRTVATGGMDGTIRLWDASNGKSVGRCDGHTDRVWRLLLTPDGKSLVSASNDGTLRFWDTATNRELGTFRVGERDPVSVALSSDGRLIACADRLGALHIWDRSTGAKVQYIAAPVLRMLGAVAFSPDSKVLAGVVFHKINQSELVLWEVATSREMRRWSISPESGFVVFAQDGRSLAVTSDGPNPLRVYETATGKEQARLGGPWSISSNAPIFSPDGRMLVTAGVQDGNVRIWEVASGKLRRQFGGHRNTVGSVDFSPDGRHVASASQDTTALIWQVFPSAPPPKDRDLGGLWKRLADVDAASAFDALCTLAAAPGKAVGLVNEHLQPAPGVDKAALEQALADLDNEQFRLRRKAAATLEQLGERAEPALRKTLAGSSSAEVRRQVEQLLKKLDAATLSGDQLREVRAVELLEHLATPEARQLLQKLATGAPEARLTREAKAALERLDRRGR